MSADLQSQSVTAENLRVWFVQEDTCYVLIVHVNVCKYIFRLKKHSCISILSSVFSRFPLEVLSCIGGLMPVCISCTDMCICGLNEAAVGVRREMDPN